MPSLPSRPSAAALLRPEHLAPIRNLQLRARIIVEGVMAGLHKSPYHGFSVEFLEYRPYFTGESTRRIDWRKYAKSDKTVVRLFEDETNLYAHILLDTSASMGFGSGAMTKFDYARTLAASLAWILIRQRDAAGLSAFNDTIHTVIPPRSTNVQLKNILNRLTALEPSKPTRCGNALDLVARTIRRRGMCIVISDLFDDPAEVIRGLRHLYFKRQDIILLWVLDPMELAFSSDSPLEIEDAESGVKLSLDGAVASAHFRERFESYRTVLGNACREMRIDLQVVSTDQPLQKAVMNVVRKRMRMI